MENKDVNIENNVEKEDDSIEINEPIKNKQNKQIMWAIILMSVIIIIILLTPLVLNSIFNKFNYDNLDFQKTSKGKLDFYSTNIPLTKSNLITGAFIGKDKITGSFPLNLRNDPRKLEYIPVDIPNKTVIFKGNTVYITMNSEDKPCEQNVISAVTISSFLMDFASFKVVGSITDKDYALAYNVSYITCNNSKGNTVIWLKEGSETSIVKTNPYCYELTYKNCEMLPVSEKFILTILEGYMSYFEGGETLNRPLLPNDKPKVYELITDNKTK